MRGRARMLMLAVWLPAISLAAAERRSVAVGAGAFNINKDPTVFEGGLEYRTPLGRWGLAAAVGLYGTEDGSVWLFGGIRRDVSLTDRWILTPAFAVSLYEEGDGKDLGGPVEFRSAIELGYQWRSRSRLALTVYHLSNGGIYDLNPGSNSLLLVFSMPLD